MVAISNGCRDIHNTSKARDRPGHAYYGITNPERAHTAEMFDEAMVPLALGSKLYVELSSRSTADIGFYGRNVCGIHAAQVGYIADQKARCRHGGSRAVQALSVIVNNLLSAALAVPAETENASAPLPR
jgi:hypothetical protein